MNIGAMRERISILALGEDETGFAWETAAQTWAQAVQSTKSNRFSKTGNKFSIAAAWQDCLRARR